MRKGMALFVCLKADGLRYSSFICSSVRPSADGWADACRCSNGSFIGDGRTELEVADDSATANRGSGWQMPSVA